MVIWGVLIVLAILVLTGTISGAVLAIAVLAGFVIAILAALIDF